MDNSAMNAFERAIGLVTNALGLGERDCDLLGLVENCFRSTWDNSQVSFDEAIAEYNITPVSEIRDWWCGWS